MTLKDEYIKFFRVFFGFEGFGYQLVFVWIFMLPTFGLGFIIVPLMIWLGKK